MPAPPTEGEALRFWLRLGCISFGGPAGQIALMHDEIVERRRWIDEGAFLRGLNACMALPGPEAQQLASYIGYRLHGIRGALAAGGLFVLPSFVLLCVLSGVYVRYGTVAEIEGVVRGLGGAVVALVAAAVLRIGGRVVRTPIAFALAVASFAASIAHIPFLAIIATAAALGALLHGRLGEPESHGDPSAEPAPSTPWRPRLAATLAAWLVPLAALLFVGGVIADLAGFFSLAALVTFGGAYAVLPFVADQAVRGYGWLSPADMVAGLALGETTPGPLIMVNTFVGFLAGEHHGGTLVWGLAGASVATACTFAPSFVFILNLAPVIDRARPTGRVADALAGVTVAVVGVIAGLAVYLARHALVRHGSPDWVPIVLAVGAFAALRLRVSPVRVIAVCAAVGLVATAL